MGLLTHSLYNGVGGAIKSISMSNPLPYIITGSIIIVVLVFLLKSALFKVFWNSILIKYFPSIQRLESFIDAMAFVGMAMLITCSA